ncbi:MAG: hypothetical protein JNM78_10150 [Cyclobacteriaceae bacterium]|nr:hypothetical protein [Cyclobacteriaceae bacterium]
MNKILFCLVGVICLFSLRVNAQYAQGDKLLNLGIGVNSYYSGGIPFSASFEYGVTDEISVGAGLDYLNYNYKSSGYKYGFSILYFGARGSYHFNELLNLTIEELDLYGGASLGFRSFSWKDDFNNSGLGNSYGNGVFFGIHAGARYYFAPSIGGFLEVGAGGSSNAKLGVAFRF